MPPIKDSTIFAITTNGVTGGITVIIPFSNTSAYYGFPSNYA